MTADAPADARSEPFDSEPPAPGQAFLREAGDIEIEAFGRRFAGHACRFDLGDVAVRCIALRYTPTIVSPPTPSAGTATAELFLEKTA